MMRHVFGKRGPRLRPTTITVGLTVAFVIALGAIAIVSTMWSRAHLLNEARAVTTGAARLMLNQLTRMLEIADAHLVLLEEMSRNTRWDDPKDVAALERRLRLIAKENPYIFRLFIVGPTGDVIASSMEDPPPLNTRSRPYFQTHRDGAPGPLLTTGLQSQASGEPIMVLSRRVSDPTGDFKGVALVSFNLGELEAFFQSVGLEEYRATFQLIDEDMEILVDTGPPPNLRGHMITGDAATWLHTESPHTRTYASLDGVDHIWAHERLDRFHLFLRVGTPVENVLARWRRDALSYGAASLLALLGLILLSFIAVRYAHREERLGRQLALANQQLEARVRKRTARLAQLADELRASLREKEVLFREVHHRVKNNLQVVSSMVRVSSRSVTDAAARDVFDEIARRIQAIALVHQSLYEQQSAANIDMHAYLAKLAELGANVYGSDERGIAICVRANGRLDLDKAVSVGVIASEVLANALKHAFPDGRKGRVDVEFSRGQGECVLCIRDDGVGMPDDHRPGTGMGIVNALIGQLEAQAAIRRDGGTVFEIRFAVPEAAP